MAVQIYHTRLRPESAHLPPSWLAELPRAKREELERSHPLRRQESVVGLRLLALAMERAGNEGFDLGDLDLTPGRKPRIVPGKPDGRRPLEFSISHTRGLAACALSLDPELPVGLDVEHRRPIGPGVLTKVLVPGAGPPLEQWTRREAVIKGAGNAGLASLREVAFGPNASAEASFRGQTWHLHSVDFGADFVAVLATPARDAQPPPAVTVQPVTWSDLTHRTPPRTSTLP